MRCSDNNHLLVTEGEGLRISGVGCLPNLAKPVTHIFSFVVASIKQELKLIIIQIVYATCLEKNSSMEDPRMRICLKDMNPTSFHLSEK